MKQVPENKIEPGGDRQRAGSGSADGVFLPRWARRTGICRNAHRTGAPRTSEHGTSKTATTRFNPGKPIFLSF